MSRHAADLAELQTMGQMMHAAREEARKAEEARTAALHAQQRAKEQLQQSQADHAADRMDLKCALTAWLREEGEARRLRAARDADHAELRQQADELRHQATELEQVCELLVRNEKERDRMRGERDEANENCERMQAWLEGVCNGMRDAQDELARVRRQRDRAFAELRRCKGTEKKRRGSPHKHKHVGGMGRRSGKL